MLFNDQEPEIQDIAESILPYKQLRGLVEKILKVRVNRPTDAEDISQNVFRRSWQWAKKHNKSLSTAEWKRLIAKITYNEINRFYSKKTELLSDDFLPEDANLSTPDPSVINPQFILEIAENLRNLSFRQRLSLILHEGEILPYLKVILPTETIADLLEIDEDLLNLLESEIPLSEERIVEVIEQVTEKDCRASIRDERSKGRKLLRRRLFSK